MFLRGSCISFVLQHTQSRNQLCARQSRLNHLIDETAVIDEAFQASMREFVLHIFDHIPDKRTTVGDFLGKEAAIRYVIKCADPS